LALGLSVYAEGILNFVQEIAGVSIDPQGIQISDFYYYALFTTLIALTVLQKLHHLKKEKKYNKHITKIKCAQ